MQSTSGLKVVEAKFSDGNLYCKFERLPSIPIGGKTFDLTKPYYLLLARGPASENGIGFHSQKTASGGLVSLADTRSVGSASGCCCCSFDMWPDDVELTRFNPGILIQLHGAFMVAAWMFAASCGILFARYFRLTWVGKQLMGKDLWFVVRNLVIY